MTANVYPFMLDSVINRFVPLGRGIFEAGSTRDGPGVIIAHPGEIGFTSVNFWYTIDDIS